MTEHEFVDIIRRALLMIVHALEVRYKLGKRPVQQVEIEDGQSVTFFESTG